MKWLHAAAGVLELAVHKISAPRASCFHKPASPRSAKAPLASESFLAHAARARLAGSRARALGRGPGGSALSQALPQLGQFCAVPRRRRPRRETAERRAGAAPRHHGARFCIPTRNIAVKQNCRAYWKRRTLTACCLQDKPQCAFCGILTRTKCPGILAVCCLCLFLSV